MYRMVMPDFIVPSQLKEVTTFEKIVLVKKRGDESDMYETCFIRSTILNSLGDENHTADEYLPSQQLDENVYMTNPSN